MKFADIKGNFEAIGRLRRMVDEDRLPHAIVIEGPEGTGKLMMARALAQIGRAACRERVCQYV